MLPLTAITLVLAACGDDSESVGSGPQQRPTGPDEVVVQVLVAGGFVPVDVAVTTVPTVTVLGDGTVITQAPITMIYPGPALLPLQSAKISAKQVDALVERARKLGLLSQPLDFGQPPVADAPDTTVTVVVGGTTYTHTANALGLGEPGLGDLPAGVSGLTRKQLDNRKALSEFVAAAQDVASGDDMWTPEEIAVFDLGSYQADADLPQPPRPWPLAQPPATADGRSRFPCTLVSGDDTATLLRALEAANARTPWIVGGQQRSLAFRPVVPGQPGCPS